MKVLHIIDSAGLYGAEVMLLNLMEAQIKQGLEPSIASIGEKRIGEKPLETEALARGFNVVKFRMRPGPNYLGALKILKYAHQKKNHILHSHGYKGNILFGFLPQKIRKIPMISTLHGWTSTNRFNKLHLYEWLDRKSLKHIDTIVLVSSAMKLSPKLQGLTGINFHIVQNGIPVSENKANDSSNQPFNKAKGQLTQTPQSTRYALDKRIIDFCEKGLIIGSIGRLSAEKGFNNLIEACLRLKNEGINVKLIIIGEGDERRNLETLAQKKNVRDFVFMPGYKEKAWQYLDYFNVYVTSSLSEGLPITILEAMQAGVPVVATKVGGIPEVLDHGNAGLLVEPQDSDSLAASIRRALTDKHLRGELIKAAYDRFSEYYSSDIMACKYLELYRELYRL